MKGLRCCGMPAWEQGDLESLRAAGPPRPRPPACPSWSAGAKVLVINPTCSMMMRREWPHLLEGADRERAERLAPAVMDVSEYLWSIRERAALQHRLQERAAGRPVAYHAPCHLRAQAVGFKGRDLLRKIPGVHGRRHGDGVLRPRRHLRHDGGGLRGLAAASARRPSTA